MTLTLWPPRIQPICDSLSICYLIHLVCPCNFGNYSVILPTADWRPGPTENDCERKTTSLEICEKHGFWKKYAFHFQSVVCRRYGAEKLWFFNVFLTKKLFQKSSQCCLLSHSSTPGRNSVRTCHFYLSKSLT